MPPLSSLKPRRPTEVLLPAGSLLVMALALILLPAYGGAEVTQFAVYDSFQRLAGIGLLALGVGLTMVIGELDLSAVGMFSVAGVLAVRLGESSPLLGVAAAVAAGFVVGAIQGGLIAYLRMSSLTVTLGGLIALIGLANVLTGNKNLSYGRPDVGIWLDQQIMDIFSPRSLITIGVFVAIAAVLALTYIGRNLRAIGGDRDASRVAGLGVKRLVIGTFGLSGALAGLGGSLLAYSTASAAANASISPLLFAITGALLGGVSLQGGRGTVLGMLCGVLSLNILSEIFGLEGTPEYVAQLVLGGLLLLVIAIEAPGVQRGIAALRARGLGARL